MKQQIIGRMRAGENVSALAREADINRALLYVWKRKAVGQAYEREAGEPSRPVDRREQRIRELEARVGQLESALGRKAQEIDFFRAALRGIAAVRQARSGHGGEPSMKRSAGAAKRQAN